MIRQNLLTSSRYCECLGNAAKAVAQIYFTFDTPSRDCRIDLVGVSDNSPDAGFLQARGRGGWFASPEAALIHLAHAFGCHSDPARDDQTIDRTILKLIARQPGRFTARQLRNLANRQTGIIPCAGARCDAAVRRLVLDGHLVYVGSDGRSAGRLVLAQRANPAKAPDAG